MATMNLAPPLKQQWFNNGAPLSGGLLYSYQAGTTTPQNTYTDQGGGTPNTNPVVLDANGEANVWLDPSLSYKFVLEDSGGSVLWTVDNIVGLLGANAVGTSAIQDGAVTAAKLANNSVTSAILASDASIDVNRAVQTNHLRDGAVTAAKLDNAVFDPTSYANAGITASVASNILTVNLTDVNGATPTANSAVKLPFRNSSLSTGTLVMRSVTSALSIAVPNGASLGTTSGVSQYIYVYAIDNAGTVELAVAGFPVALDGRIVNTTVLSSGATDQFTLYSANARTGVAVKYIGKIKSSQVTAGTWVNGPSEISLKCLSRNSEYAPISGFTFAPGFGTTTGYNLFGRRLGDSLEIRGHFISGAVSTTTAYIQLPSSIAMDTAKLPSASTGTKVGAWSFGQSASTAWYSTSAILFYDGSTNNQIYVANNLSTSLLKANCNSIANNTLAAYVSCEIPISGWGE